MPTEKRQPPVEPPVIAPGAPVPENYKRARRPRRVAPRPPRPPNLGGVPEPRPVAPGTPREVNRGEVPEEPPVAPGAPRPSNRRPGPQPGSGAARGDGLAALEMLVAEHSRAIVSEDGTTVRRRFGPDFYAEIGRRGGLATRQVHGLDYYAQIGKMGGLARHKRRAGATAKPE